MSTTAQTAAAAPPPPTGPRRGGRRGGAGGRGGKSAGASISAAAAQPDDTEEVRKLRAKYADKLSLLRELFPDWTDEDLLFALQEAGGEMELAVGRISEGHAEQFSSVKSKKQVKKDVGSTPTPTTFQGATAPSSTAPGNTQASRGGRGGIAGARGGRGGAARGARGGGRGGIRGAVGGRGGSSHPVDGRATDTSAASSNNVQSTPTGATWADTVAATSSKSNGAAGGSWGDDTEGLDLKTSSAPAPAQTTVPALSEAKPTQETATEKVEEKREEPGIVASTLAKIIPSKLVPKGSKMSWAQIARPADPPKAAAVPEKKTEELHPAAKKPAVEDTKPATETVPAPAVAPAEVDPPAVSAMESQPANTANVDDAGGAAEILPASTLPPGLGSDNEPATAGEATSKTSAGAGKPGMGRSAQSQRAIQRAKQQEAVVMAKSNAPYDNLGVRFGSLNFLGGEENEAETGGTAPTADSAAVPASDPNTAGSGVYAEQQAQEPAQTTTAPAQVAQQTQTAPTHQDAYAQATTSPYNGKQEATNAHQYGYQQGLAQHQQAHQAAVAQAQAQTQQPTPAAGQQQPYQQAAAPVASSGYGAAQSGGQQQQALPSQYGDYYGGLDSQRLSSFYGNYDQQSAHASRGNEDRGVTNAAGPQQSATSADAHQVQHGTHPSAAQAAPQQQQHFPNVMPYYYPHYYLPNQFQHYGQPGAGYGQYGLYGQQPPQQQQQQHPSKPATPAAVHSSYSQNGPADVSSGAGAYGSGAAGAGQYSQSPGVSSALTSGAGSGYNDSSFGRHGGGNDYSKLYASSASPAAPASSQQGQHSNSIPGLGGFLGQSPAPSNGNVGGAQTKNGSSNALESAYRQYDNGKVGTPTQQHQQQQQQGSQPQAQTQQQQQHQQQQQQQQYYQQYNAYAAHQQQQQQQPSAGTGSYQNYPYRQYWG